MAKTKFSEVHPQSTVETTTGQVIVRQSYAPGKTRANNAKLRRMRKDPVIALCRYMFFAGILSGEWSFEGEDPERVQFIEDMMRPMRRHVLATGALGCFDYGWQPYEKIFEVRSASLGNATTPGTYLKKLKPLIQDATNIKEDTLTGAFEALENGMATLPLEKCLLLYFDVEGTDWKGQSTLENAEWPYDAGFELQGAAERFDAKMAGAHWVIRYPDGYTNYQGKEVANWEIADAILQSLQSSGQIAIPISQEQMQAEVFNEKMGWHVELITASGASFPFADRFDYLDKSKARALGFPERTLLEGSHGTLAEAGAHQDFLITLIEYRHECLLELINWHLVNQLLVLNYGEGAENSVVIKAAAINDSDRTMLRAVYEKVIGTPDGMLMELDRLDLDALADSLGIPRISLEELEDQDLVKGVLDSRPEQPDAPDAQEQPATQEQPDAPASNDVQATALNGSQISSLLEIILQVTTGELPKPSAQALILVAFPLLTVEAVAAILDPIQVKEPAPSNLPPAQPPAPEPEE